MKEATETIIALFGGVSSLAHAIKRRPSTVQYWSDQGRIPKRNLPVVVKALRSRVRKVAKAATAGEATDA